VTVEDIDQRVRLATFAWLQEKTALHGEVLARETLARGFLFDGRRVPLIGPQGIFKPAVLPEMPLSITTVPIVEGRPRPYDDEIGGEGVLRYRYRRTDPAHRDNAGLRLAMQRRAPLVYQHGIEPGRYMPHWPVFIVGDDPGRLVFTVQVDDARMAALDRMASAESFAVSDPGEEGRRSYVTRLTRQRIHQQAFRERVLRAYRERCAICRLRHEELLDAAHILPDGHPRGKPVVPNGLALCKLHHAAFDRNFLGIRPDLVVMVRPDLLKEPDGPMLRHGLQEFHEATILVPGRPALRPNPAYLEERYAMFKGIA